MGNDNIDVGNQTASRQRAERPVSVDAALPPDGEMSANKAPVRICGAMSQQRGDSGHESAPQKLLQLVGYRDPKARPDAWIRPTRVAAIKR